MTAYYDNSELDSYIHRDAILLAKVATFDEIMNDDEAAWSKFVTAGGDNSHSGASWGAVKNEARKILSEPSKS